MEELSLSNVMITGLTRKAAKAELEDFNFSTQKGRWVIIFRSKVEVIKTAVCDIKLSNFYR